MNHGEFAAFIQSKLREKGIDVVLSGGGAATIYTTSKYVTHDLDMVIMGIPKRRYIREVMEKLGFQYVGRQFTHPETNLFVEFPPGPLSIGDEPVGRINEMKLATGLLRVLSPTDSVKDRLSAYYHWNDRQSLEQAILIAKDNDVDVEDIRRWSIAEGNLAKFEDFITGI
jgi:hypothetical protein